MKISQLTPEQKTRLLVELDGITPIYDTGNRAWCAGYTGADMTSVNFKAYLTSYDAIIPLVQKLDTETQYVMYDILVKMGSQYPMLAIIKEKPSQLCDAVLVATGKAEL